jgi:5-methyltetrahydrofolate--homocysteine methyltransferase
VAPDHAGARSPCGDAGGLVESARRAFDRAVFETDKQGARDVVLRALDQGVAPEALVFDVVIPSLQDACDPGAGATSLAQHFMAALIAGETTEDLVGRFGEPPETVGRVVIGTASGDFHGLGARVVGACLRASMIEVADLGRDVGPRRFVDEALAREADVICVSSMMVHTAIGEHGPAAVRRLLADAGLEDRLKLVVGGAPYGHDPGLWRRVGADGWADDGLAAAPVIADLIETVRA